MEEKLGTLWQEIMLGKIEEVMKQLLGNTKDQQMLIVCKVSKAYEIIWKTYSRSSHRKQSKGSRQ